MSVLLDFSSRLYIIDLSNMIVSINEKLKIGKSTSTSVSLVYNEVVIGISFKSTDSLTRFIETIESIKWR